MEMMASSFPGAFAGYSLEVVESHQRSKADTSGTAKAVLASFQRLGLQAEEVRLHFCADCVSGASERPGIALGSHTGSTAVLQTLLHLSHLLVHLQRDIRKVRDVTQQMDVMRVPDSALDGHAFHTYRLRSPDGSVTFEFQHNVCGRRIYAEGTVDAALFLAQQIREGSEQRVFNMVDVLRAGNMR